MTHLYGISGQEEALAIQTLDIFEDQGDFDIAEKESSDRYETIRYEAHQDRMAE